MSVMKQTGGCGGKGKHCLSHGSNISAGVAVLFTPALKVNILAKWEIERGRCLAVRAEIGASVFVFVNVYAPNKGCDRVNFNKSYNMLM